jgi:hypothetical protein
VVYTWVDSTDAEWRAQRDSMTKRRIRAQLKTEAHRWPVFNGNLSELAISLKTVRAFAPLTAEISFPPIICLSIILRHNMRPEYNFIIQFVANASLCIDNIPTYPRKLSHHSNEA